MRRPRIVWRVSLGSTCRTTHGGTRLVVDKAKLRAKVQAAVRKQAAHTPLIRPSAPRPSQGGGSGARGNRAAARAQAIEKLKNEPSERLLAGLISSRRLIWLRHQERSIDTPSGRRGGGSRWDRRRPSRRYC